MKIVAANLGKKLSRERAVELCGEEFVKNVENKGCDLISRPALDNDDNYLYYRFEGTIQLPDEWDENDEDDVRADKYVFLKAVYLVEKEEVDECDGDYGAIDFDVDFFVLN